MSVGAWGVPVVGVHFRVRIGSFVIARTGAAMVDGMVMILVVVQIFIIITMMMVMMVPVMSMAVVVVVVTMVPVVPVMVHDCSVVTRAVDLLFWNVL